MFGSLSVLFVSYTSGADLAELAVRQRLREDAVIDQTECVPLGARLGLEIPEDPALGVALEGLQLRLDVSSGVILESLRPLVDVVNVGAGTDVCAAGVCAIVARADAVAVQCGGAVGHGGAPFANEGPLVGARVDVCVVADVLSVLPGLHSDELVGEALVLVMVDGHVLSVVVRGSQESIVAAGVLETVLHHHGPILRYGTLVAVAVTHELLVLVQVELREERLVQQLDAGNDVVVGRVGVLVLNCLEHSQCALHCVALLPSGCGEPLAGVVEPILRSWGTVQVDQDLEPSLSSPVDLSRGS